MPRVGVTKFHPVQISGDIATPKTVKNLSGPSVTFGTNPIGTGSTLTNGSETTVVTPMWFASTSAEESELFVSSAASQVPDESETGSEAVTAARIAKEAVTSEKIATNAVTAVKIEENAVEFKKAKRVVAPVASGTESLTTTIGTNGVARTAIAVYNAKAEASQTIKVKHGLQTEYVHVTAYVAAAKKAVKKIMDNVAASTGGIVELKVVSAEEIELVLGSGIPVAKEEFFYVVTG